MTQDLDKWIEHRVADCRALDERSETNRLARLKGEKFWNVLNWTLGLPSAVLTVIAASVTTATENHRGLGATVTLISASVASIVTYCQPGARKQTAKRLAAQWNAIRATLPQVCDGFSSRDKDTRRLALKDLQTLQAHAAVMEGWSSADALPDWDPVTRLSLEPPAEDVPDDPLQAREAQQAAGTAAFPPAAQAAPVVSGATHKGMVVSLPEQQTQSVEEQDAGHTPDSPSPAWPAERRSPQAPGSA